MRENEKEGRLCVLWLSACVCVCVYLFVLLSGTGVV